MRAQNPGCWKCGGETILAGQIQPLGSQPGSLIFDCRACGQLTWTPVVRPTPDSKDRDQAPLT